MLHFSFNVGIDEVHNVEFYFNQFWGNLFIKIDGFDIVKEIRLLSLELTKVYEFHVGINEINNIRIEKVRKLLFAGFREYKAMIYINGQLVDEHVGKLTSKEIREIKK